MSYSRSWQEKERLVGAWFGTCRNPLSGRNNVSDRGVPRCGDVILGCGLVEVKRKKNLSMRDAQHTQALARDRSLPFAHFEFKTQTPNLVSITLEYEDAKVVCQALRNKWQGTAPAPVLPV